MPTVFNLNLDEEILSHLPLSESWIVFRGEDFKPDFIADEDIRNIYHWTADFIRKHKQPPTPSVLCEEWDIDDLDDPQTAIGDLIDKLRLRYMEEGGRDMLAAIGEAFNKEPLSAPKVALQQGKILTNLLQRHGEMFGTGDYERAKDRYYIKAQEGLGPSYGFESVDDYLGGQRGVTSLMGNPKSAKSWFMVNGIISNVRKGFYPWLYALELPAEETDMRLRCMWADVPWSQYLRNNINRDEWEFIKERSQELDGLGVYKISNPERGDRELQRLVDRAGDAGAQAVFIDQLQHVEIGGKPLGGWNETGKYWEVMDLARELSKDIPIFFAHQFNRSALRNEEMPRTDQIKASQAVEETSTTLLGIWASPEMRKSQVCELSVLLARNHPKRSWRVNIDFVRGCNLSIDGVIDDE